MYKCCNKKEKDNYFVKNKIQCNKNIIYLMLSFSILFVLAFTFIKDDVAIIIISSLVIPFALHSLTKAVDDYFKSRDIEKLTSEAKTYFDAEIITEKEYQEIIINIRKMLEDKNYIASNKQK